MSGLLINPYAFAVGGGGAGVTLGARSVLASDFGSSLSLSQSTGWEFTPARDIEVAALSFYANGASESETVTIFRRSDEAVMAQETVSASSGWGYTELSAPVTLASGVGYTIARYDGGASRTLDRELATEWIDPAVTIDNSGVVGAGSGRPTSNSGSNYISVAWHENQPADTGYRFYRLTAEASVGSTSYGLSTFGVAEVASGTDVATTNTIQDISDIGLTTNLYDGDTRTGQFESTSNMPREFTVDFGSANIIDAVEYLVGAHYTTTDTNNRSLGAWSVHGSKDYDTWTLLDSQTGVSGWSVDEVRRYPV